MSSGGGDMQRLVLLVCSAFVAASAMAGDTTWREFGSKRGTVLDANVSSLDLSKTYPTMWVRLRFPALESGAVRTVAQYEFDCEEEEMHLLSEQSFDADGELVSAHEMDDD